MQPFPSFAKREVLKNLNIFFPAPTWSISPTNSWSSPSVGAQPNVRITCTCQKSCCSKSPKEVGAPHKKPNKWSLHLQFPKVCQNCSPGQAQQWWWCRHRPWTEKAWKVVSEWFLQYNLLLSPVKEWKDVFVLRKFLFGQALTSLNSRLIFKSHWDLAMKAWYMLSVAGSYINEKDEFCMCRILAFEYKSETCLHSSDHHIDPSLTGTFHAVWIINLELFIWQQWVGRITNGINITFVCLTPSRFTVRRVHDL